VVRLSLAGNEATDATLCQLAIISRTAASARLPAGKTCSTAFITQKGEKTSK